MTKLKAILFLIKCVFYISFRILRGRTWNRITVDLEDTDISRTQISYAKTMTGYSLQEFNRDLT